MKHKYDLFICLFIHILGQVRVSRLGWVGLGLGPSLGCIECQPYHNNACDHIGIFEPKPNPSL